MKIESLDLLSIPVENWSAMALAIQEVKSDLEFIEELSGAELILYFVESRK